MDLWLTGTERSTVYGHSGFDGNREPAPGKL